MQIQILHIKKRDGREVSYDRERIKQAIKKAFLSQGQSEDSLCDMLTLQVERVIFSKFDGEVRPSVEQIQDIVETILINNNYPQVAKHYILYRAKHAELREEITRKEIQERKLKVVKKDGQEVPFNVEIIHDKLTQMSFGLQKVSVHELLESILKTVYNGISTSEIDTLILNAVQNKIEEHYHYSSLASRILLNIVYEEVLHISLYSPNLTDMYRHHFKQYLEKGIASKMLNPALRSSFDLNALAQSLDASRDLLFYYLGSRTLYDRYLLRERESKKNIFELPQWMWMRIAMGLALNEEKATEWAIEFYHTLSQMYGINSTPTLFNAGTLNPQMSSCFLNTVEDSLEGIFKTYSDNALMCKWSGAVGTDWTPVRSKNSLIMGTNGPSQGVIPFIKIFNDCAIAVNQGGKRRGALAAYMEPWHADFEEFLELRKNTGDERRRAHDIHTACWIPDLFMKRVRQRGTWTFFSPNKVKDLHDLYGKKFEERYQYYEQQNIEGARTIEALDLWKKMLTMLYETGHPWITFKDPSNVRSPQDHVGVVHASNLCTEITLNTSKEETAVCNLASLNLARMIKDGALDEELIGKTVSTLMRMLDNVVTNNFYTIPETEVSNLRHRPVGLGIMGYQDALYQLEIDFDSAENLEFSDFSMEMISYYVILASSRLAKEKGKYKSYQGSKWDRGIFPLDSLDILERERGIPLLTNKKSRMDWSLVKEQVRQYGMRNSNCMAIAPTATIANIAGVVPCVEPIYKNIYMKENMGGNFLVINHYLIDTLDSIGMWNKDILTKIKMYNGSIAEITGIPIDIRKRFKEVFEIDPLWIIKCAAFRTKWIDQASSTNIFLKTKSGQVLSDVYMMAWEHGLKTTYYLRSLAESQVTKSTSVEAKPVIVKSIALPVISKTEELKMCKLDDPACEACE